MDRNESILQTVSFLDMVLAASCSHIVKQLLYLKRCFGVKATVGIVTKGIETDYCATVAELIELGHAPKALDWIDRFIRSIPTVYELASDDLIVCHTGRYLDGGPACPWDVAKQEQERARSRAAEKRRERDSSSIG